VIRHISYSHDNGYDSLRIPNKLDVGVILKNVSRFRFFSMILLCIYHTHLFVSNPLSSWRRISFLYTIIGVVDCRTKLQKIT
jgi:hypothetical protein